MLNFPKNFFWGSAMTAHQTEGMGTTNRGPTVWDIFYKAFPEYFHEQVGPDKTSDIMRHYKSDIALLSKHGHNSLRSSFNWARLFPDGENADPQAVSYYHDFISEIKKNKMTVMMALLHFDLPMFCQDTGGLLDDKFPDKFARYADFIFAEYGQEVDYFFTLCEPVVPVHAGYLGKAHWPRINNPKLAVLAGYHEILAHAKAVEIFNKKYRGLTKAKIAINVNISPAIPKDGIEYDAKDAKAAETINMLMNYSFADAMIMGTFDKKLIAYLKKRKLLPETDAKDLLTIARVKTDFIAINYYSPNRVQKPIEKQSNDAIRNIAEPYKWPKARMNVFRGWEIYPEGMEIMAEIVKKRYDNMPFLIAENGMGVQNEHLYADKSGKVNDQYRIAFVSEHLASLHKAIQKGAPCIGYHMWAPIDNWSMANAYKNRYGFISVDLKTMKRTPKASAEWYKTVLEKNGIDGSFKKIEETIDLKKVKAEKSINL